MIDVGASVDQSASDIDKVTANSELQWASANHVHESLGLILWIVRVLDPTPSVDVCAMVKQSFHQIVVSTFHCILIYA
jgi:hypothetical protein